MSEGKITLEIVAPEFAEVAELPEVQAYLRRCELLIEKQVELRMRNLQTYGSIYGPS